MFTTYTSQTDSNDFDYWDAYLAACIEQKRTLLANCLDFICSICGADRIEDCKCYSPDICDPLLDKDEYDERNDV